MVVAFAVAADGTREVLGVDVGDSEDETFWTAFLRSLGKRRLTGVQLVISDAHEGLKAAVRRVLTGASWQRCRVHFNRNILARVGKAHGEMVTATIRTIFAQPDADAARGSCASSPTGCDPSSPPWPTRWSTPKTTCWPTPPFPSRTGAGSGPPTRTSASKRRANVVRIFPDDAAVTRLIGACYWKNTTNGKSPPAATSLKNP